MLRAFVTFCLSILFTFSIASQSNATTPNRDADYGSQTIRGVQRETEPVEQLKNLLSKREKLAPRFLFTNPNFSSAGFTFHYVNTFHGNISFHIRDLVIPGRVPIVISRIYNSSLSPIQGSIGFGWKLNYDEYCLKNGDRLTLFTATGDRVNFTRIRDEYICEKGNNSRYFAPIEISPSEIAIQNFEGWVKSYSEMDGVYRLTRITSPAGNTLECQYKNGLLQQISNDSGGFVNIAYSSDMIVCISDSLARSVHYFYNEDGLLTEVRDRGDNPWSIHYSGTQLVEIASPENRPVLKVGYTSKKQVRTLRDEDGSNYFFSYDGIRTVCRTTRGGSVTFSHTPEGLLSAVTSPDQSVFSILYDDWGGPSKLFKDGKQIASYTYNENGQITSITLPSVGTYNYEYQNGRMVRNFWPDGFSQDFARSKSGAVTDIFNTSGFHCTLGRSDYDEVISYSNSTGQNFQIGYDDQGRINSLSSNSNKIFNLFYDDASLITASFTDGYEIDAYKNSLGRTFLMQDTSDLEVIASYDSEGRQRLINTNQRINGTQNIESVTRPDRESVLLNGSNYIDYEYDGDGDLSRISALNQEWAFAYDEAGNIASVSNLDLSHNASLKTMNDDHIYSLNEALAGAKHAIIMHPEEFLSTEWELFQLTDYSNIWEGICFNERQMTLELAFPTIS